jgi:ATPase subunit of ABC transporter with duplicated ATPase domains
MAVAQLRARSVSKSLGPHLVLRDVSVTIAPRIRIGLLGPNGVGKSTLLRVLAGIEPPDSGSVERSPADAVVGHLTQEHDSAQGETLLAMLERRTGVAAARAEAKQLEHTMGDDLTRIERYASALERVQTLGAYDFESRAAIAATEVGLGERTLVRLVATLSGGQRARAALAAILLSRSDVLLLDEPTNDLDLEGLERLERFVDGFAGGLVVVSHDRAFLDRCVDRFVELDPFTHETSEFAGSWSDYERMRNHRRDEQREAHGRAVAERDRLLARARAIRTQSEKSQRVVTRSDEPDKHIRFGKISGAQGHAAKAVGLEKRAARIEVVDEPRDPWVLRIDLTPNERGPDVVATLSGAIVERGGFRLGPLYLEVRRGERIAVVGPNGSGKSTLLEAVLGHLPLAAGSRRVGISVVLGSLAQERTLASPSEALLDRFIDETALPATDARTLLAKFDLGADDVVRPIGELSPGERSRAALAVLAARRTNCLVLDEPTNHLDLSAIEELERSLAAFEGTFLIASHDRQLLANVGITRTIELRRSDI